MVLHALNLTLEHIHEITQLTDESPGEVASLVFDACFGTDVTSTWGECGVAAVSTLSAIRALWDCRYEEGNDDSDDMMGELGEGVTLPLSSYGIYCSFFRKGFSLWTDAPTANP